MKFSIRDLLLVTVIVALALGWWLDHREWVEAYSTKSHESKIWLTDNGKVLHDSIQTGNANAPAAAPANAPANPPAAPAAGRGY